MQLTKTKKGAQTGADGAPQAVIGAGDLTKIYGRGDGRGGDDTISVGGGGDDVVLGFGLVRGADNGDRGNDVLSGGAGDDRILADDERGPAEDVISCGPGRDMVDAARADRVADDCEVVR
jgi:Ca2+-binding RTX toxin-like protein